MRRVLITTMLASVLTVGVTATVLFAQAWPDSQTSSGAVNVTTESADLYICEPAGSTGDPDCPGDDSAGDETIFETNESLYPGATVSWDIRLRNVGGLSWDVTGAVTTITETQDPGADCNSTPTTVVTLLGNPPYDFNYDTAPYGGAVNDNHLVLVDTRTTAAPTPPSFRTENRYLIDFAGDGAVHAAPGGYDDMRIRVTLPGSVGVQCKDNIWDVGIAWTVTPH